MTIPTYEDMMLPIMKSIKDGKEYSLRNVEEAVSREFQLSEEEQNRMLPSGKMTYLYNRIGWAKTSLKMAGLLEQPRIGIITITNRGLDALRENLPHIDLEYLSKFSEFVEWQHRKRNDKQESQNLFQITKQTPDDMISAGYDLIRENLYNEILEKVKTLSDQGFERLVLDLCKKMNYGDWVKHTGKSGDQGIDGIIKEDRLGLGEIYLQAKRWQNTVTSKEVRDFAGSLQATKTKKGIFITTSDFTPDGREFITKLKDSTIILINGKELAKLMEEYDVGVSEINSIRIKKIDHDYFEQYI